MVEPFSPNTYLFDEQNSSASAANSPNRYQSFSDRKVESCMGLEQVKGLALGKYHTTWEGSFMMKDPLTMGIYGTLIAKEKIGTIFEIGSYLGSSAVWFETLMSKNSRPDWKIISYDYDLSRIPEEFKGRPNVEFLYMDANQPDEAITEEFMSRADFPHPWLVIEDAHVNVEGLCHAYDKFLQPGDYLLIEDTNPMAPDAPLALDGSGKMIDGREYTEFGMAKLDAVAKFLDQTSSTYKVDSFYTDLYGYNASNQWNSILRKF